MRVPQVLRFRIVDLYMGLICFYPITTVLIDGTIINKLMFAAMIVLQVYMYIRAGMKRKTVMLLGWMVQQYIFVIYHTDFPLINANLLFYYPFFMMYTSFLIDNKDTVIKWLKEHRNYIHGIVMIWSVIVGISIFVPGCYYVKEGGASYFGSWTSDIFRLGPSVMFIQILVIVLQVLHKQKGALAYMIIPMYCVLMGSSRTYLVISGLLLVICWYISSKKKSRFWLTLLPVAGIFLMVLANASIGDKILFTLDDSRYGDFWFRITSSRSVLWATSLGAWDQLPVLNKVLGCDINLTHRVTDRWAHNDFIEILCSFGIVGVIQYIAAMSGMLKNSWKDICLSGFLKAAVIMVWLFNAFFNMHYVYFCAMLSFPFLVFAMRSVPENHIPNRKTKKS